MAGLAVDAPLAAILSSPDGGTCGKSSKLGLLLMGSPGLPRIVVAFLRTHLRDVNDLALLVAVASDENRWWDEVSVAKELSLERSAARAMLEHFAVNNLLEIRVTEHVRYQFGPGRTELREAVRLCLMAYRENPILVWRAVAQGQKSRGVRDFADAFRIRRDDDR